MNTDNPTIAILGKDIPYQLSKMPIDRLYFLPDNPRVYSEIRKIPDFNGLTSEEKRERIHECMLKEPSVKNLEPEIARDRGLRDPIIVRTDTDQVIDGNSRLAVYRRLREEHPDDERWNEIDCVLIASLTDEQQARLLGQTHLKGRTEWSTYAQAFYCYRWVDEQNNKISSLVKVSGISKRKIDTFVSTIRLMKENKDEEESRFSYYNVLVTSRKISSAIEENPDLREKLLQDIKANNNNGFTAQKMRDQLPYVIDKPKVLRKFVNGNVDLEEAYDRAKITDTQKRLKKILSRLDDIEKGDITRLERNELRAVEQLIKKIDRSTQRIGKMINSELNSPRN
ncbi:MAG: hypothetical protein OXH03_07155 [Bacteroidetes bacterium]|nr:hypothetical protein [Bacteroidota bacterium]